jgi:hypothetical protein
MPKMISDEVCNNLLIIFLPIYIRHQLNNSKYYAKEVVLALKVLPIHIALQNCYGLVTLFYFVASKKKINIKYVFPYGIVSITYESLSSSLLFLPLWSIGMISLFQDHFTDGRTP